MHQNRCLGLFAVWAAIFTLSSFVLAETADYVREKKWAEAVWFLKAKSYTHLAIVSHSMGARMSGVYMAGKTDSRIKSWASLGCRMAITHM